MTWLSRLVGGLRGLQTRRRADRDLDEELREFLAAAADDRIRSGVPPERARREAGLQLGSAESVKDHVRDAGWDSLVLSVWRDARYGLRSLLRTPGTTTIIVLALGIG